MAGKRSNSSQLKDKKNKSATSVGGHREANAPLAKNSSSEKSDSQEPSSSPEAQCEALQHTPAVDTLIEHSEREPCCASEAKAPAEQPNSDKQPNAEAAPNVEAERNAEAAPNAEAERNAEAAPNAEAEPNAEPNPEDNDEVEPKIVDRPLTQIRISRILDAVLQEEVPVEDMETIGHAKYRYPVYVDGLLAMGLLIAVAGFTVGLFKMYVNHQAKARIMQSDYRSAINLLRSSPMPAMFNVAGGDPQETLSQALYLDSLKKFDDGDTNGALAELGEIRAGSKYFDQAQKLLSDNFVPSDTVLQCGLTEEAQAQTQP